MLKQDMIKNITLLIHTLFISGGITTLIDMPLNSYPSTVSKETLQLKVHKANLYTTIFFFKIIFSNFFYVFYHDS